MSVVSDIIVVDADATKKELLTKSKEYFESVKGTFEITVSDTGNITEKILPFFGVFLGFSILPILPAILRWTFTKLNITPVSLYGITIPIDSFYFLWLSCFLVSLILFVCLLRLDTYIDGKKRRKYLAHNLRPFCYLFNTLQELKLFLINEQNNHLSRVKKDIQMYVEGSDLSGLGWDYYRRDHPRQRVLYSTIDLDDPLRYQNHVDHLIKQFPWFKIDSDTARILEGLKKFHPVIIKRIKEGKELDSVVSVLEKLVVYEYCNLGRPKQEELSSTSLTIEKLKIFFLLEFANDVVSIKELKDEAPIINKSVGILKTLFSRLNDLLYNKNVVTSFFSWYILLLILFTIPVIAIIVGFKLTIDTTLTVGVFSAPFLGAITFATAIYTRNKG